MYSEYEPCEDIKKIPKLNLRVRIPWHRRYKIPELFLVVGIGFYSLFIGYKNREIINTEIRTVSRKVIEYCDLLERERKKVRTKEKEIGEIVLCMNEQKKGYEGNIEMLEKEQNNKTEELRREYESKTTNLERKLFETKKRVEEKGREAEKYRIELVLSRQVYKKPQVPTPVSRVQDNKTSTYNLTQQTKTQNLEERVKGNLKKWLEENEHSSYSVSIEDGKTMGKHIWLAGYFWRGAEGIILYSSDEGKTWEIKWKSGNYSPNPFLSEVEFLNESEGWAATSTSILCTINGGSTWYTLPRPAWYTSLRSLNTSEGEGDHIRKFKIIDDHSPNTYISNEKPYNLFAKDRTWTEIDERNKGKDYLSNSRIRKQVRK